MFTIVDIYNGRPIMQNKMKTESCMAGNDQEEIIALAEHFLAHLPIEAVSTAGLPEAMRKADRYRLIHIQRATNTVFRGLMRHHKKQHDFLPTHGQPVCTFEQQVDLALQNTQRELRPREGINWQDIAQKMGTDKATAKQETWRKLFLSHRNNN